MKLKRLVATLLTVVVLMGLLPMSIVPASAATVSDMIANSKHTVVTYSYTAGHGGHVISFSSSEKFEVGAEVARTCTECAGNNPRQTLTIKSCTESSEVVEGGVEIDLRGRYVDVSLVGGKAVAMNPKHHNTTDTKLIISREGDTLKFTGHGMYIVDPSNPLWGRSDESSVNADEQDTQDYSEDEGIQATTLAFAAQLYYYWLIWSEQTHTVTEGAFPDINSLPAPSAYIAEPKRNEAYTTNDNWLDGTEWSITQYPFTSLFTVDAGVISDAHIGFPTTSIQMETVVDLAFGAERYSVYSSDDLITSAGDFSEMRSQLAFLHLLYKSAGVADAANPFHTGVRLLSKDEQQRAHEAQTALTAGRLSGTAASATLGEVLYMLQFSVQGRDKKLSNVELDASLRDADSNANDADDKWWARYTTLYTSSNNMFCQLPKPTAASKRVDCTVYVYGNYFQNPLIADNGAAWGSCGTQGSIDPIAQKMSAQIHSAYLRLLDLQRNAGSAEYQGVLTDNLELFVYRMYVSYGVMTGILDEEALDVVSLNPVGAAFMYSPPPAFMTTGSGYQTNIRGAWYFLSTFNEYTRHVFTLVNSLAPYMGKDTVNKLDDVIAQADAVRLLYQMLENFDDLVMWEVWRDKDMCMEDNVDNKCAMSDVYDYLVAMHAFDASLNSDLDAESEDNFAYFFTKDGLSQSVLKGVAASAQFLPMRTNVYDPATWRDCVDTAWLLNYYAKFGYFRKALYIDTSADAAVTYGNTGGRGQLAVATLEDLLEDKDIVLYLDDNLYNVNTLSELIGKSWDRLGQASASNNQSIPDKLGSLITSLWEVSMPELAKTAEKTSYSSRVSEADATDQSKQWGGLFLQDANKDKNVAPVEQTATAEPAAPTTPVDPNATTTPADPNATTTPADPNATTTTEPGDTTTTTEPGDATTTTTVPAATETPRDEKPATAYRHSSNADYISYYLYPDYIWNENTNTAVDAESNNGEVPHTTEYTPLFGFAVLSAVYKDNALKNTLNAQLSQNSPVFVSSGSAPYVCESLTTSIFNYMLLRNLEAQIPVDYAVSLDMTSPLYMDIFGNILTESGYVVVPAAANATLWGSDYRPYNAAFFACYGDAFHLPVYDTDSASAVDRLLTKDDQALCSDSNGEEKGGVYLLNALRTTNSTVNAAMLSTANKEAMQDISDTFAIKIKSRAYYDLSQWKMIITEVLRGAPIENIDKQFEGIQTDVTYTRNGLIIADKLETLCNAIAPAGQNASLAIPNPAFMDGIEIIVFFVYKLLILAVLIIWMVNVYLDATAGVIGWRTGAKCIGVVVLVLALIVGVPKIFELSYYESNKLLLQDETEYLLMLNTEKQANGQEIGVTKVRVPDTNTKLYLRLADIEMPWWDLLPKIGLSAGYKSLDEMYKDYTDRHPLAYSEYATTMNDGIYISSQQLFDSAKVQFSPLSKRMFLTGSDNTPASYYTPYYFFLYSIVEGVTDWSKAEDAIAYTTKVQKGGELKTLGYCKLYFESPDFMEEGGDYFHLYQLYNVPSEREIPELDEDTINQLRDSQWCAYNTPGLSQKAYIERIKRLQNYAQMWIANNHDMIGRVSDETFLKCFALSCAMEHNRLFNTMRADYLEIQELSNEDLLRLSIADHNKVMSNSTMSYARFVYTTGGTIACYMAAVLELVNLVSSWVKPACTLLVFCIACISIFVLKLILRRGNNSIMGYILTIALMCSVNVLGAGVNKLSMYLPNTGLTPTLCILLQVIVQIAYIFLQLKIVSFAMRDWRNVGYQQYEHQFNKIHLGRRNPMLSVNVSTPRGLTGYEYLDGLQNRHIARRLRR